MFVNLFKGVKIFKVLAPGAWFHRASLIWTTCRHATLQSTFISLLQFHHKFWKKIFVKIPIWTWKSFLISAWEDQIYPRPPHTSWSTMATDPWCSVGNIGDPGVISSRSLFDVWWLDRSIDWRLSCKDFRSKLDQHCDRPSGKKVVMIQPSMSE